MSQPLRLSVSLDYTLRWPEIEKILDGELVDPRSLYTVRFQLLAAKAGLSFGAWTNGAWETNAPAAGPYAATFTIGPGQPAPLNPGLVGTYFVWGQLVALDLTEDPAFQVGTVILSTP